MNAQNAKEYLPLVQALAGGKTIQQLTTSQQTNEMEWRNDPFPTFAADPKFYRVKPEPRRWWLVGGKAFDDQIVAGEVSKSTGHPITEVVEVVK